MVLGVLVPAVEQALEESRFGTIGVIGTRGVIQSQAYERELEKYSVLYAPVDKRARKEIKVYPQTCPLLAPLIEEGLNGPSGHPNDFKELFTPPQTREHRHADSGLHALPPAPERN